MKHYFTYLLLTVSSFSFSQQNKFLDKFSLGMNFKLPKTIENTTFRKTIYGVGDIELNFNFKLAPNFEISLGHKYGYYDINSLAFQENIEGQMEMLNPFLEFSYINSLSNRVFFDIGIKGGYNISFTRQPIALTVIPKIHTGLNPNLEFTCSAQIYFLLG